MTGGRRPRRGDGRLRVLAVLPTLARGGAEVQLIHLLDGLPGETTDHRLVTLLSQDPAQSLEDRVHAAGLPWLDLNLARDPRRPMGLRHAARNLLAARRELGRVIRAFQPDVVYSRVWFASLAVALLDRRRLGFRHVVNEEAALVNDDDPGLAKQLLRRWVTAQADAWVVPTRGMFGQFADGGASAGRGHVIYNATPMPPGPPPAKAPGPVRFAAMGRLAPTKGFDRLLGACVLLRDRGVPFLVDVAGEGPDREALERRARDLGLEGVVNFVGYAKDPIQFLLERDAFVLTSRDEGFANVIVEAMACWLPVVSFDIDFGPRELVVPGETGFLVADGDLAGLADRMEELARDPDLRARFGEAGRAQAVTRYSVESMVGEFTRLFASVQSADRPATSWADLWPGGAVWRSRP